MAPAFSCPPRRLLARCPAMEDFKMVSSRVGAEGGTALARGLAAGAPSGAGSGRGRLGWAGAGLAAGAPDGGALAKRVARLGRAAPRAVMSPS